MPTLHLPNHQSFVAIDRYREQSAAGNARVEFKRYEEFHNSDSDEEEGEETPMEKKDSAEDKTAATSDFTNVAAENTAKTLDPVESDSHNQRAQIRQTPMATEKCTASKEIGEGQSKASNCAKQLQVSNMQVISSGPGFMSVDTTIDGLRYTGMLFETEAEGGTISQSALVSKEDRQKFVDFSEKKRADLSLDQWTSMLVCRKVLPGKVVKRSRENWARKNKRMICYSCLCVVPDAEAYTMPFACKCREKARQRAAVSQRRLGHLTGYDRLKIVAQLPPPSTVELAPKIKAVEVRVAETGNKNVPSSTKVQKSMPNGPQMAVKKSEIILPNKKGLQNPTETDKLNQQRQQLQHQINPPPKRLLAPPPLLTKKLSVTGSLLPANRLPPMNYNSLESSSSFVQQISANRMILMPKRRQIKPTLLRGPSGGKLLQASFSSSSANNIVRSIPPPPKKVNNIPPPSLSFFAANKTNKTTNLANQFLMLKNVEKEEISLGNEEKKTTITNSQSEIPTKQNSKLPLELAKSLEDNGSTIVSATPLISPTSSSWCVVHKNEGNPLQMTILKAAGTSPGGGEQQLPTLEEAKKIDEQIGLLRGSAPKQMAPPPFKLIGKNSSNNVYPDDKDLCKPLHQLIAERKAKDASVGSKNNNIQVRQVLRPSQLAAAAKMMMGNNSNQIEQKKRPSSLLFNKNNLQEQQQNNNQLRAKMTIGNPNIVSSSTKNLVGTPQTQNERSSLNKAITKTKTMPPQNSNPTSSATASVKKQLCYRTDSLPIHSMRIAAAAAEKCSKRTAVVREPSLLDTTPNILAKNSNGEPSAKKPRRESTAKKQKQNEESQGPIFQGKKREISGQQKPPEILVTPTPCSTPRQPQKPFLFKKGDVVWAKAIGLPFWPGVIDDHNCLTDTVLISWCGETTYSDVSTEKVETFLDHLPHRFPPNLANLKQSKNKKFCTAVADAIVAGNYGREELVGKVHPTVSGILASKYHWDTEELEISLLVTKPRGRPKSATPKATPHKPATAAADMDNNDDAILSHSPTPIPPPLKLDEMEEKKDFVDADVRKCSTTETELEIDVEC